MRIRHILPADGLCALYAIPQTPYWQEVPCHSRWLVEYKPEESDINVSEEIGTILSGTIVPATNPQDGSYFVCYTTPGRYTDDQLDAFIDYAQAIGRGLELAHRQLAPDEETGDDPTFPFIDSSSPDGSRDG